MTSDKGALALLILGSGPAGLTAALYAARANLHPVLISGSDAGGQLMVTTDVENYPGFPGAILGPELIAQMRKQAERFGTEFITGDATKVDLSKRPFAVEVNGERRLSAATLIIASGARAKLLGLKNESRLMGRGVSACAVCDGPFFKGKELIVVGGGDTAMEEATFLTKFAGSVAIVHRREKLRASMIMQDRARANPKISFLWDTVVEDILGEEVVTGVRLRNVKSGEIFQRKSGGVFIAIGHEPNTGIVRGQIETDELGYIKTKPGTSETSVAGVFAAGDVADRRYRQAVTAAGTGCMAAMDAEKFLEGAG